MREQREGKKHPGYLAPVLSAAVMVALMAATLAILFWAYAEDPSGAPPVVLTVILVVLPVAAVIVGVLAALSQRIREIEEGELEEAQKY